MDRDITRRDFLNGTGIAVGGSLLVATTARADGGIALLCVYMYRLGDKP